MIMVTVLITTMVLVALLVTKILSLRGTAVMGALMLAAVTFAKTPDLNGVVLDEKNEPMPFVNVVLI